MCNTTTLLLSEDADNEYAALDSTIVRAHQHSAGAKKTPDDTPKTQAIGRSKGGLSTKIHLPVTHWEILQGFI